MIQRPGVQSGPHLDLHWVYGFAFNLLEKNPQKEDCIRRFEGERGSPKMVKWSGDRGTPRGNGF